jgi:hypothetical protein
VQQLIDPLGLEEIPQAVLAPVAQLSAVWKSAAGQLLDHLGQQGLAAVPR